MTPTKKEFAPTTVEQYRSTAGKQVELTLPSGAQFVVKRLSPLDYIREGLADIPNEFVQFITEVQSGKPTKDVSLEEAKKNYQLFDEFLRITLEKGVISPPVTLRYDKDKIATHLIFGELSQEDQVALVNAIIGKM